jgi:hypothetical protein
MIYIRTQPSSLPLTAENLFQRDVFRKQTIKSSLESSPKILCNSFNPKKIVKISKKILDKI